MNIDEIQKQIDDIYDAFVKRQNPIKEEELAEPVAVAEAAEEEKEEEEDGAEEEDEEEGG